MNRTLSLTQWLCSSRPDDTPIAWLDDHTWTLGQLRHDVARLVSALQQQEGERWALCFENSYLFIVALLATLSAGKTPVIPGHCRVSLLEEQRALFHGILSDQALSWRGTHVTVASAKTAAPLTAPLPAISDTSFIELFTSGSTGQPKRVVKSITALDREASILADRFAGQLTGCRVVASVVPQHLYGLTFRIFLPMSLGMPLHAAMLYYAEQLAVLSHQHRYLFVSSPAFLKRLDRQLTPPPITLLLSAGGLLPWQSVIDIQHWLGIWPDEIYGSTETGILAWRHRQQNEQPWHPFPEVRLMPEARAFRAFSPLIACEEGHLLDDILQINDNGTFRLAGRRGRVVKIEEKRISLSEVEQRLMALDGIHDAVALPVSRGHRQGIGVLLVLDDTLRRTWQESNGKALELSWRRALLPWLEPVAIPRYWRVIDEIPVNSMNKRVYTQLQALFNKPHEIERRQTAPDQLELVLHLDPTLFWFQGHFSVQPLLPALAQLDWVMYYATPLLPAGWRFHSIQNVKFQAPLLPDNTVTLILCWQEERRLLTFSYQQHQGAVRPTASSGKIRLCP